MQLDEIEWQYPHPSHLLAIAKNLPPYVQMYRFKNDVGECRYSIYSLDCWLPGIEPLEAQCVLYHLLGVR